MKKSIYLIAAAAMTLAGCSQDDLLDNGTTGTDGDAIAFESYLGKSAQTRATEVTTESLKGEGFTVDAYYTGTADFSAENPGEVFMKATKVTYNKDKGAWTYSPVKYWPNNAGDRVSFFAYGPSGNTNIKLNETSVSSIDFTVQNDVLDQVDFIYNNQETNSTLNKQKQTVDGKVRFQFQHALSRIAFTVAAAVDETSLGSVKLDGNSRINVKKVALVSSDVAEYSADAAGPFYKSGTLNMLDGTWSNLSDETQAFTFAGKKHFYRTVQDKDVAVNPETDIDVVQLHKFNQKQRLLNDDSYLMIIPTDNATEGTKTSFKIYIEYDVITEDDNFADGSKITNCILSKDALEVDFEAGKAYNFNLILGMTSVKFDVDEVTPWDETTDTDEWLPENEKGVPGTEANPYLIETLTDLEAMVSKINSYAEPEDGGVAYAEAYWLQVADIDMSTTYYEGSSDQWTYVDSDFSGTYDGGGFSIDNFYSKGYSLFYKLTEKGMVKSVKITNGTNTGASIVSQNYGTVLDCSFSGNLIYSGAYAGSIVNANYGDVIHCYFDGTIKEGEEEKGVWCGAIVGETYEDARVIACYNKGTTTGFGISGIIGYHSIDYSHPKSTVAKAIACYNIGNITTTCQYNVTSIAGINNGYDICIGCYNAGSLNSNSKYGKSHIAEAGNVTACYYDQTEGQTSDNSDEIGVDGNSVTWETAMNSMNQAIKEELGETTPYIFVLNTDESTKKKQPLILKVDAPNQ